MSHTIFQAAQIIPIPPTKPLLPPLSPRAASLRPFQPLARRGGLVVRASSSSVVDGDALAELERCFRAAAAGDKEVCGPVMKGGQYGALGATTLEKSKLDRSSKQQSKSSPEVCFCNPSFRMSGHSFWDK